MNLQRKKNVGLVAYFIVALIFFLHQSHLLSLIESPESGWFVVKFLFF